MEKMPYKIKQKLRKLQRLLSEAQTTEQEARDLIESYGVDIGNLDATGDGEVRTEALAYICNTEGRIEENIKEIEEVFLHYANGKRD